MDLREDWTAVLADRGFAPDKPTAWLAEGLLMYLNRRTALTDVAVSDAADRAVAELFVSADRGGPDTEPATWLAKQAWDGTVHDFVTELASLDRATPSLFDPTRPDPLRLSLFTATKPR